MAYCRKIHSHNVKLVGIVGLTVILSLVLMIPAQEASAGGACTQEDIDDGWICIFDRNDLEQVSNDLSGKYKLASDIDLGPVLNWTPIGSHPSQPFTGKFDGNGYVISNMNIFGNDSYRGLFGYTQSAEISNVRLIHVSIDVSNGASSVGGLIGRASSDTKIANSLVTGSIKAVGSGSKYVGGLIGYATNTEIKNASFHGTVEGDSLVGGLIGLGVASSVYDSHAAGTVIGDSVVGGLIGYLQQVSSRVERSYAAVNIEFKMDSPENFGGGFVGVSIDSTYSSNFWNSDLTSTNATGAAGKSTAEMKMTATYLPSWNFGDHWKMIEHASYPVPVHLFDDIVLNSLVVTDVTDSRDVAIAIDYEADQGYYQIPFVYDTDEIKLNFNHSSTSEIAVAYRSVGFVPSDVSDHYPEFTSAPAGWNTALPTTVGADSVVTIPVDAEHTQVQIVVRGQGSGPESVYKLTIVRDNGSSDYPHHITTAEQLAAIGSGGYSLGHHYELMADLDLSGYANWNPIGDFYGYFDGNDHVITNLTINNNDYQGLFREITTSGSDIGTVTHLHLRNVDITGRVYVGGITANNSGKVLSSSVTGIVDGKDIVGGIAGRLHGSIEQSYVIGEIVGANYAGGLVGQLVTGSTINESYAAVNMTSIHPHKWIGGLIGGGPPETILYDINRSYWDNSLHETSDAGIGLNTANMKKTSSFSGWNFSTDWGVIENTTYPMHRVGYEQVLLNSMLIDGDPLAGFSSGQGTYTIFRGSVDPIMLSPILAATASGSTVSIDDNSDLTKPVLLSLGMNEIEIQVDSASGAWTGLYILHIYVDEQEPDIEITLDPNSVTADDVKIDVKVDGTGSNIQLVKWAAGNQNKAYFELSGTTLDGPDYSFTVGSNSVYTVYARDEAGNERVETVTISYIVKDRPIIGLNYDSTPTNGSVALSVTTVVYGQDVGNAIAELRWAPGSLAAGYFAGSAGTDVIDGQFPVTENGIYTVYALDVTGLETVETVDVNWIVKQPPVIAHDYEITAASRASITINVTAAVYGSGAGNGLAALKWVRGDYPAHDFSSGRLGQDITASGRFTVVSNGNYTIYARDTAGNESAAAVTVNRISDSSSSSPVCPADACIHLAPGEAKQIEAEGLIMTIPANATNQSMTIMLKNITSQYPTEQWIGQVYEVTKSVAGHFLKPVTLEFRFDPDALGDTSRPAIFYYDEDQALWIELDGTRVNSMDTVQGETNHFTKFAVLAVQDEAAEPGLQEPDAAFSDMGGHWARPFIIRAVREGFVNGYTDGTFRPNQAVTRAEFTVMMARALRLNSGDEAAFKDKHSIPVWARQEAAAAVSAGILSGYDDGTFRPYGAINRAEMAVMAARAAGHTPDKSVETPFADNADIPNWARPYVAAAYESGLIVGRGGNQFAANASLTRAEAVIIVLRLGKFV